MDWRVKVKLFEQIRQEYEFGVGTIAGVAKRLGIHRRMVREAIGSALPKPRAEERTAALEVEGGGRVDPGSGSESTPETAPHCPSGVERIQIELPDCKIGERTVRQYVHDRKIALGFLERETRVPQLYVWGVEAQIDWYEAYADLSGEWVAFRSLWRFEAEFCTPAEPREKGGGGRGWIFPAQSLGSGPSSGGCKGIKPAVIESVPTGRASPWRH